MTALTIKARPTTYKGIRMRSRLEADYAAYLDRTKLDWQYEPECFANEKSQWLPDFGTSLASDSPYYIEVKPISVLKDRDQVEVIDGYLTRMTAVWASRPLARLSLDFWEYGAPWSPVRIFSNRWDCPWYIDDLGSHLLCAPLWPGMGQVQSVRDGS